MKNSQANVNVGEHTKNTESVMVVIFFRGLEPMQQAIYQVTNQVLSLSDGKTWPG